MKGWSGANKEEGGGKEGFYQKGLKHWRRFRLKRKEPPALREGEKEVEAEEEEEDLFQGKVESETERGAGGGSGGGMSCGDPPGVSWPNELPHSGVEEEREEEGWMDG